MSHRGCIFYQKYGYLPQCRRNFDRITAAFFYAQKPFEIRIFSYFDIYIDPDAEVFYNVFSALLGILHCGSYGNR